MAVPQKNLNRITFRSDNTTSRCRPRRSKSSISQFYLYIHIHKNIIYKRQKMETTQGPWMNKQIVVLTTEYYSAFKKKKILMHTAH